MAPTSRPPTPSRKDGEQRRRRIPRVASLTALTTRISQKMKLESKTHHQLPETTTAAKTNFHLRRPGIYEAKKQKADPSSAAKSDASASSTGRSTGREIVESTDFMEGFHYLTPVIRRMRSLNLNEDVAVPSKIEVQKVKKDKKTGLMDLTPELRKSIYRKVVVTENVILVCTCSLCKSGAQPALTRVNRQIRKESLPIFCGENVFRIREHHRIGSEAPKWIRSMSLKTRSLLEFVEFGTFDVESAKKVMEKYGLQLREEKDANKKGIWVGNFGGRLTWILLRGTPLDDKSEPQDESNDAKSMAESTSSTIIETGIATVARVVRPKLIMKKLIPHAYEEKELPPIPKNEVGTEKQPSPRTTSGSTQNRFKDFSFGTAATTQSQASLNPEDQFSHNRTPFPRTRNAVRRDMRSKADFEVLNKAWRRDNVTHYLDET